MNGVEDLIFVERAPTVREYQSLRDDAGWCLLPDDVTEEGLKHSLWAITVQTTDGTTIGTGRLVGDGGLQIFLTDIIVLRSFRNLGVGTTIVKHLVRYVTDHVHPQAFVGLFSALDHHHLYELHGFVSRPNDRYGPGMHLVPKERETC